DALPTTGSAQVTEAVPASSSPSDVETVLESTPVSEIQNDSLIEVDAETLADNQVLQSVDQIPPEDPGEAVAPQEPVFDFPVIENEKVRYFIDYYTGRAKKTFTLWLERSGRYLPMMQRIFAEAGLPKDLAYLAMVESGFNDKAYSWAHAVGPWQFIASTGKRYGLKNDWWYDERRDPEKATYAAARFLSDLYEDFDGDWYLAVASYNAGPGKLRNAIKRYKTRDFWEISRGRYLKNETKNYVPKLLAALLIAKQPEKYGFTDLDYHEPLRYETVSLPSSTDLEVIARLSGEDYQTIKTLNPELKRWCTPPNVSDYLVRLPAGSTETFLAKYTDLPKHKRANYVRHKVKSGDTLLALSKRYGVRVKDIRRLNSIRNARAIQIGTNLIIPLNPDAKGKTALAALKDDYKRSRRKYYTVRSGDSIWTISRKFNVTEKQLRVWNRLGWSNVIRPGQRLIVSSRAAKRKVVTVTNNNGPVKKVVYQVRPGDTLWAIGREFSVAAGQIRSWNNLAENHILQPGDKLTLHVSVKSRG
ncbi:MAG: LysM peptidoglycan-binding domain-containing protein, partial [Gammaproteobacteria bacterium]|nr:LysM peptidoglycan-binding domain-containing protein [Gammaproteobacteria bacterium]NIR94718.1 LysM peptidoglycan-binding domain-containing protein [Gammaproteobacteria bacterium]